MPSIKLPATFYWRSELLLSTPCHKHEPPNCSPQSNNDVLYNQAHGRENSAFYIFITWLLLLLYTMYILQSVLNLLGCLTHLDTDLTQCVTLSDERRLWSLPFPSPPALLLAHTLTQFPRSRSHSFQQCTMLYTSSVQPSVPKCTRISVVVRVYK